MQRSESQRSQKAQSGQARRTFLSDTLVHVQNQAIQQVEQIRRIQGENDSLKEDIAALAGTSYDYVKADKMAALKGEVDALERRYQFEKMRKNDLIKREQLARLDLLQSRKLRGGVNIEREHAEAIQRQVTILEGRLDQALGKFNDALLYNRELRDQIDIIRGERRVFQQVHKKLDEDLRRTKRLAAERLEQYNRDMDERDHYVAHVHQLEQQIADQQKEYRDQVRQLDMAMMEIKFMRDEQTNMQLELEGREYELEMRLADEEAMHNLEGVIGSVVTSPIANHNSHSFSQHLLTEDGGSGEDGDDGNGGKSSRHVLSVDREAFTISEILLQIRDVTQEEDLSTLQQEYLRLGDTNFSLYKKINELTTTNESLEDEIRDLKSLIQENGEEEAAQKALIKDLEGKLATTESMLEGVYRTVGKYRDALLIALGTTEDVYSRIGCDKLPGHNPQDTCTESSLLNYLGRIEERATLILLAYQRHQRMEGKRLERQAERLSARMGLNPTSSSSVGLTMLDVAGGGGYRGGSPDGGTAQGSGGGGAGGTLGSTGSGTSDIKTITGDGREEKSPRGSFDDLHVPPALPIMPGMEHNAVSAVRIVRQAELPTAQLGGGPESHSLLADLAEDKVVSHEEIRRQMEIRLISKREREERAARRRREKEAAGAAAATAGCSTPKKKG